MLLNISSSPISHRNPHFLSNFNNPISYFPRRSKTHLSKSHFFPKFTPLSNQSLKNRVLFGNKRYPDGERFDFRSRAISGIDLGSFESVLEAIAVLTTIIVVHESGHFLAASLQGIHVSKFAIGFGPILAKFDYNNVEYSLRAFPLGGFVGFPDNDPDSEIPIDDENLLKNRPTLDRSIVVSAGIIANVIFAYAIIFVQVLSVGLPVQEAFPGVLVPEVKTFSAASRDGLLSGDVILAVDGTELSKTGPDAVSKIVDIVKRNPKSNVVFRIERGGEDFDIRVTPDKNFDGTGKIGVQLSPNVRITKVRPRNIPETMLLNISSSPISHRNPHFLSNFNNPISYFPRRSKTHLSKSHFFPKFTPLSNQSLKNRVLFGNKRYPDGERFDFRSRAISGIDLGSFESVLEAIAVLTTIIVVHESGHFLAASLQGIHVSKFAIGFGPILAKFDYNNVEYSLRAFPLGGFVGFPDNDPDSEIPIDDENLLKNRPTLDRSIVVSAGIIANVIFAYAIIFVQVLSVGLPVQEAFPGVLVPEVKTFSAASRDGLLSGDVILAVDGTELSKTGPDAVSKIVDIVKRNPKSNVVFRIERREFMGLSSNVLDGLKQTFFNFSQTASKVAGPVAIIAVGAEVARSNIDGLYQFAALLNINLAVINLLPLPALDGGTLALILLEAVRGGKKLPVEVEQGIMSSGIMLVIFLGLFLIVKDTLSLDFIKEML